VLRGLAHNGAGTGCAAAPNVRYLPAWLVVLCLVATPASASQIAFTGVGNGAGVTFSLTGDPLGNPYTGFAGEIEWAWVGTPPAGYDAGAFYAYCLDAMHYLLNPETVTAGSTDGFTSPVADAGGKAAWLFNEYAAGVHNESGALGNTDAAALQVAIWEAVYDTSNGLSNGSFRLLSTGPVFDTATQYLDALYSKGPHGYHTSSATWLDAPAGLGQDQIIQGGRNQITQQETVPEPASMLLCATGLAALRWVRRNRRESRPR
jgi:hypothetical protein